MTDSEKYKDWIETIQIRGRGLTKWEEDFVESVSEQLTARGSLSPRQADILERIYAEKTPL